VGGPNRKKEPARADKDTSIADQRKQIFDMHGFIGYIRVGNTPETIIGDEWCLGKTKVQAYRLKWAI